MSITLDAVKNFGKVEVSTTYNATDVTIVLSGGEGATLPNPSSDGEFNLVWWNQTDYADPTDDPNVEIVRCTARTTDTLTVTRGQESTSGSTKNTASKTYRMILTLTAKTITDIESHTHTNEYVDRQLVQGSFRESFDALSASDGTTVTVELEQNGGGDLTMQFSDGDTVLDCTPVSSVEMTPGTVAVPQKNYVYIPQSTKILTVSTSGFPTSAEHIKVAFFYVPSAVAVQSDGCFINQNWNDHLSGSDNMGHLLHMAERSRMDGAYYFSGIDGNATAGKYFEVSAGDTRWKSTAGVIFQMHRHAFPAKDTSVGGGDHVHVTNWNGSAFNSITNLFGIVADATGTTIANNKYFNLVLWAVANKGGTTEPIMINLPTGFYNSLSDAQSDINGYDVLEIPREFNLDSSTGFLICRVTIQMGATWSLESDVDLRGSTPTSAKGGASSQALLNFPDNQFTIFDGLDNTKVVDFLLGSVTTGNTRTLTVPDASGTIALQSWVTTNYVDVTGDIMTGNLTLNDNVHLYLGTGNDLDIYHNGTTSYINNSTGGLYLGTTISALLGFRTANVTRWVVNSSGQLQPNIDSTYDIGTTLLRVANLYVDDIIVTGNVDGVDISTFKTSYDSHNHDADYVNVSGDTMTGTLKFNDNVYLYFGTGDDFTIFHDGSSSYVYSVTNELFILTGSSGSNVIFGVNNTYKWVMDSYNLYPYLDSTYNIGTTSYRVAGIYVDNIEITSSIGIGIVAPTNYALQVAQSEPIVLGTDGGGQTFVASGKTHNDDDSSGYGAYWAYDCYFDDDTNTWESVRSTLGGKWKTEVNYHASEYTIDYSLSATPITWTNLFTLTSAGNLSTLGDVNVNSRINLASADGVLTWGSGAAHGKLTWDTNKAIVEGLGTNALYLKSGTGTIYSEDHFHLNDNFYLYVGTGNDLQLYHDGTNSYISHVGTGGLYVGTTVASTLYFRTNNVDKWYISATAGNLVPVTDSSVNIGSGSFRIQNIYSDALDVAGNIGVTGTVDGKDVSTLISSVVEDTTPQLGGNLSLNSKGIILESQTIDAGVSTGDLCYYDGTDWNQADADAESTCSKMFGISLGSSQVLTYGIWTTTGLTNGSIYYASITAGGITTTKPSATGDIVRVVGYALSTTQLMFIPDGTFVEIV